MTNHQALLLSIRPRFVDSIFAGTKTVELRRVKPRVQAGDLVVVYASGAIKGLFGAFEVTGVTAGSPDYIWKKHNKGSGLTRDEFDGYFAGVETGYAICIGKLWRLPEPVLLPTLRTRRKGFRPPQSYQYWSLEDLLVVGGGAFTSRTREDGGTVGITKVRSRSRSGSLKVQNGRDPTASQI